MYIDYKGQYSRLNQNPLFGQHREWIPNDSIFNKGFSFDGAMVNKIKKFASVTFKPGWKIVKIERGERYFEYKDSKYRTKIQNRYNIHIAENRDIIPDAKNEITAFAGEFFLGNRIQTISLRSEVLQRNGKPVEIGSVQVKCAVGVFEIPAAQIVSLEPLKITKEDEKDE
jgi:hypothetical protein